MNVDVEYHHYRIEIGPADDVHLPGDFGALSVGEGSVYVPCWTESGPLSLRVLVGDHAPGAAEESWIDEWESVQSVVFETVSGAEIRTWEGGPSEPESGVVARPGRWCMRWHARGERKVAGTFHVETPLEEHLILLWPEGATVGTDLVWDEVVGKPQPEEPFTVERIGGFAKVKAPGGFYRFVWDAKDLTSRPAPERLEESGFVELPGQVLVSTGGYKSLEVTLQGSRHEPGEVDRDHLWRPIADVVLDSARPVRILDGSGSPPRALNDPILPPGRWHLQLRKMPLTYAREHRPWHEASHDILIWAEDSPGAS